MYATSGTRRLRLREAPQRYGTPIPRLPSGSGCQVVPFFAVAAVKHICFVFVYIALVASLVSFPYPCFLVAFLGALSFFSGSEVIFFLRRLLFSAVVGEFFSGYPPGERVQEHDNGEVVGFGEVLILGAQDFG